MGYRGEDASRTRGDWGRHAPWQPSPGMEAGNATPPGGAGPWDDEAARGGANGGYGTSDGGYGYPPHDGYGDYDQPNYDQPNYDQQGRGQYDGYGPAGYPQQPGPGYGPAGDGYPSRGYGQSAGYPAPVPGSGGYPAPPGGPGGPGVPGGYPAEDAGNDWYGGQPAAASGASFADTGTYALNGRVIDEYGTGPSRALHDPVRGYPPTAPRTGQQERYDDYGPYPGYRPDEQAAYPGHGGAGGVSADDGYGPGTDGGEYDAYGEYDEQDGYGEPGRYPAHGQDDYQGYGEADDAYGPPPARDGLAATGGYDNYAPDGDDYPDPYPPGPYQQEEEGHGHEDKPGRRAGSGGYLGRLKSSRLRSRKALIAVGTVGTIVVATMVYFLAFSSQSRASNPNAAGPIPTAGAMPSTQACTQQFGTYCHIELRKDDPTPLTISELFPPAFTNEKDKSNFTLVSTKLDKTCSNAVIGQNLINSLSKAQCTQVLRASYLSGDEKIMGTIGVLNLATTNQAHYAGRVVGQDDFIAPLAATKGVATKLGQGTGVVEAEYKGHYLILTWAEFVDGTTPSTNAQDKVLEQFSSDLIAGTANISLSQRMVTGGPASPGAA